MMNDALGCRARSVALFVCVAALAAACGGTGASGSGHDVGGNPPDGGSTGGGSDGGTIPPDLQGVLPAQVGGVALDVHVLSGTEVGAADPAAWTQLLAGVGATPADVSLALAAPAPAKAATAAADFRMGALRIAKFDWASRLPAYIQATNAAGKASFAPVTLSGKTVYRGNANGTANRGYYHAVGETLFFFTATDESKVVEALGKLPATPLASPPPTPRAPSVRARQTATGVLQVVPVLHPPHPLCVGEPQNPGERFLLMVFDSGLFPPTLLTAVLTTNFGHAFPPVTVGPDIDFEYQPTSFGAGSGSHVEIDVFSPEAGSRSTYVLQQPLLDAEQCLNGAHWSDGTGTLQFTSSGGTFNATEIQGTLSCGDPEAFSGTFTNGTTLAGSDLSICSPSACVSAGLLPKLGKTTYKGTLSDDGLTISFDWDDLAYKLTYDPNSGALVACTPQPSVPANFTVTRPAADPWTP